jgi:hypothetical protein
MIGDLIFDLYCFGFYPIIVLLLLGILICIIIRIVRKINEKNSKKPELIILIISSAALLVFVGIPIIGNLLSNFRQARECRSEFIQCKECYQTIADKLIDVQEENDYNSYFIIAFDDEQNKYIIKRIYPTGRDDCSEIVPLSDKETECLKIIKDTSYKFAGANSGFYEIYVDQSEVIFHDAECTKGQVIMSRDKSRTLGVMSYFPKEYKKYATKIELGDEWYSYYYVDGL